MTPRQRFILTIGLTLTLNAAGFSQPTTTSRQEDAPARRSFTFYGDFRVLELDNDLPDITLFDLILYSRSNQILARQRVAKGGRFSFNNILEDNYTLAVELNNLEIARLQANIAQRKHEPIRRDLELEWTASLRDKYGAALTSDTYNRTPQNRKLFELGLKQISKNELPRAIATLHSIAQDDPKDYQSWNELGLVYLIQKNFVAAENSFAKAIEANPEYLTAYLNLGRMRLAQGNNEGAILAFKSALAKGPKSALAHYFLGEVYSAARNQSVALGYLNEALKLDPVGMANAHLRVATIYDLSGRKDLAAIEYNEFLKKKPDYAGAERLREYIRANNPRTKRSSKPSPAPDP